MASVNAYFSNSNSPLIDRSIGTLDEGNVDCEVEHLYLVSLQVSSHAQISFLFALKDSAEQQQQQKNN